MRFVLNKKKEPSPLDCEDHMFRLARSIIAARNGIRAVLEESDGKFRAIASRRVNGKYCDDVSSQEFWFEKIPVTILMMQDVFLREFVWGIRRQVERYTLSSGISFEKGARSAMAAYKNALPWAWRNETKDVSLHISGISEQFPKGGERVPLSR